MEERLFTAMCFLDMSNDKIWLIDSGCTHHMTVDESLFNSLDKTCQTKVRIGDGSKIQSRGKGVVTMKTPSGTKSISDVLYVLKID